MAQHLTSTAISAAFLMIWYPRWLGSEEEKLKVLEGRRSFREGVENKSEEAKGMSLDSKLARVDGEDGRGVYFRSVPTAKARIEADVLFESIPMVSLTLFFSSLLPCLLHVCLYIWSASSSSPDAHSIRHGIMKNNLAPTIPTQLSRFIPPSWSLQWAETWHALAETMQKEGIDEMWVVVRLLAGMSSGFGLRGEFGTSSDA